MTSLLSSLTSGVVLTDPDVLDRYRFWSAGSMADQDGATVLRMLPFLLVGTVLALAGAVMATPYDGIFVFGSQDPRSRVLTDPGFTLPADLDKVIGDEFGANISKERTDLLDTDAIVWIVADPAKDEGKLDRNPLYADLKVAKEDHEVYVKESSDYGNAISFVTVLSLPYTLDRLAPQLAAAVDGKPATRVAQPAS